MTSRNGNGNGRWHISTLGALVVGLGIIAAMVAAISFSPAGFSSATTPVVVSILGLCSTAVGTVLAVWKSEQAAEKTQDLSDDLHNGVMTKKVMEAIRRMSEEEILAAKRGADRKGDQSGDSEQR